MQQTTVAATAGLGGMFVGAVGELWETGREFIGNAVETVRDKISEIGDFLFGWL